MPRWSQCHEIITTSPAFFPMHHVVRPVLAQHRSFIALCWAISQSPGKSQLSAATLENANKFRPLSKLIITIVCNYRQIWLKKQFHNTNFFNSSIQRVWSLIFKWVKLSIVLFWFGCHKVKAFEGEGVGYALNKQLLWHYRYFCSKAVWPLNYSISGLVQYEDTWGIRPETSPVLALNRNSWQEIPHNFYFPRM